MELLDRILTLTDEVQRCIDAGRWADASGLETERIGLLSEFFDRADPAALGPDGEQLARDLLSRNASMMDRLRSQRGQLDAAAHRLNTAGDAVEAYQANAADSWGARRRTPG